LGRKKKCLGFLTDQRSRRAGTATIRRPAEPAGIAILESNVADILADYREWRDQQPTRVSTHSDRCHLWHERCMIDRLADALVRARLTDAEREAIREACDEGRWYLKDYGHIDTLRGLLERNGAVDGRETVR
jgi:hypothetical protein